MRRLTVSSRFLYNRYREPKPVNHRQGFLGQEKDYAGMEVDKFRRYINRVHLGEAGKVRPNFLKNISDLEPL